MKAAKRARIYDRDGHRCVKCNRSHNLTLDHIIPVSYGGTDDDANLQTFCIDCNQAKADSLPEGVTAKRRVRRRLAGTFLPRPQHHRFCDPNYCFVECPIFLDKHPQLREALAR